MAQPANELQDESVVALLETTRLLVNEAHRLSASINETVDELEEFAVYLRAPAVERRMNTSPYEGEDRREH